MKKERITKLIVILAALSNILVAALNITHDLSA